MQKRIVTIIISSLLIIVGYGFYCYVNLQKQNKELQNSNNSLKEKQQQYLNSIKIYNDSIAVFKSKIQTNNKNTIVLLKKVDWLKKTAEQNKNNYKQLDSLQIVEYLKKYSDTTNVAINELIKKYEYYKTIAEIVPIQQKIIDTKDTTINYYKNIVVLQDSINKQADNYISALEIDNKKLRQQIKKQRIHKILIISSSVILIIILL